MQVKVDDRRHKNFMPSEQAIRQKSPTPVTHISTLVICMISSMMES